jgi:glutamine amidotransferase
MVGLVERLAKDAGVDESMQMTVGISDGNRLWTIRYSSMGESRSLFYTSDVSALRELYPDNPRLDVVGDNARIVTSEPTSDRAGVWNEVPEATALYLEGHTFHHRPFMPVSV